MRELANLLGCGFSTPASHVDGVHLDTDQHCLLGEAMASAVRHLFASQAA